MSILKPLYKYGSLPLSFLITPFLLSRERGRIRLGERFGRWNLPQDQYLWFHGASLGEAQGLVPLIKLIKAAHPQKKILLTLTSPTGIPAVHSLVDQIKILPFDSPVWIRRALSDIKFEALILTETELWPNLIFEVAQRSIPIALVNAKISDLTQHRYNAMHSYFSELIAQFSLITAGDEGSYNRFSSFGVTDKLLLLGNSKFDRTKSITDSFASNALKTSYFANDKLPVLVLGSIHPEEASLWLEAISIAKKSNSLPLVVIAPRHQERFDWFCNTLNQFNLEFTRRSKQTEPSRHNIVLLDTIGELEQVYSFANGAFIGGTLNHLGGHNPLEAAPYGAALMFGPNTHNIREIAGALTEKSGCLIINTSCDALSSIKMIYNNEPQLIRMGQIAHDIWQASSGASQRIYDALIKFGVLKRD